MGRCSVVRARKLFSAVVLKNYAGHACCGLLSAWSNIYIYIHTLRGIGIYNVCMYYLLLRFYDNCHAKKAEKGLPRMVV